MHLAGAPSAARQLTWFSKDNAHMPVTCSGGTQAVDAALLQYTVDRTLEKAGSANLLFAFDYTILASTSISIFVKCAPSRLGQQTSFLSGSLYLCLCLA